MKNFIIGILVLAAALGSQAGPLDTWTNVLNLTNNGDYYQIVYGNGHYVATSLYPPTFPIIPPLPNGAISASSNGVDWVTQPVYDAPIGRIIFGNNTFVTILDSGSTGYVSYSTNGSNWNSSVAFPSLATLAFGNGFFAAVGYNSTNNLTQAYLSTNAQTWSTNTLAVPAGFNPTGIAYGQGVFVMVGGLKTQMTNNYIFSSSDGKNWTNISPVVTGQYGGIACVNNIFSSIMSSNLALNFTFYLVNSNLASPWTTTSQPDAQTWAPMPGNGGLYVALNRTNYVLSSSDYDTNWIIHPTGFTNTINFITYADGRFFAACSGLSIFVSGVVPPSVSLLKQTNSSTQLTLSGGVGPTVHLQASTNFSSWTNLAAFTNISVSARYLDTNANKFPHRYYRTVSP